MLTISTHTCERLVERLRGIVTAAEIVKAVGTRSYKVGETWVRVRTFPQLVQLPELGNDGNPINGDVVYAVVKRRDAGDPGAIVTVMLRRKTQTVKADHLVG